jgi:3-oxoacyl-[acyl-carrier protein] reductase
MKLGMGLGISRGGRKLLTVAGDPNSVSPAPIATRLLDDFMAMLGDRAANALALPGRAGSAREAAEAIVFLASEASGWIKGHDLIVDGGVAAMLAAQELGLNYGE